jgi:spore coat polysaccharide biosynthesis predicted glycosyltransferase SpsG
MRKAFFLTEASRKKGSGHLVRCIQLADELTSKGVSCTFLLPGGDSGLFEMRHKVFALPDRSAGSVVKAISPKERYSSMLIIDSDEDVFHEIPFQETILSSGLKLMHITIMDAPKYLSHILLNPNVMALEQKFDALEYTRKLLGPEYFIFKEEFRGAKAVRAIPGKPPYHLLIAFGGSDPNDLTVRALKALLPLKELFSKIDVVLGGMYQNRQRVNDLLENMHDVPTVLHFQTGKMKDIMERTDLALISGGLTFYELTALGIPSLIIASSERERQMTTHYHEKGYALKLGDYDDLGSTGQLSQRIREAIYPVMDPGIDVISLQKTLNTRGIDNVVWHIEKALSGTG